MKNWYQEYSEDIKRAKTPDDLKGIFFSTAFNTELEDWEFLRLKWEMVKRYNEIK